MLRDSEIRCASSDLVEGDHLDHEIDVGEVRIPVADDHRVQAHVGGLERQAEGERVMVAEAVHGSDAEGNFEAEAFLVHHPAILDAVHNDLGFEWMVVPVHPHLEGQTKPKMKRKSSRCCISAGASVDNAASVDTERTHRQTFGPVGCEQRMDSEEVTVSRNRVSRRAAAIAVVVAAATLATACLAPPSSPVQLTNFNGEFDPGAPDPAGILTSTNQAQIYYTSFGTFTDTVSWNLSNNNVGPEGTALTAMPTWWDAKRGPWAPTVRQLNNGKYLMVFSASQTSLIGDGNCLGVAESTQPASGFVPNSSIEWCDSNRNTFWVDPQLFIASDGTLWLYYSREWAPGGGSEIDAQQLSANGLSFKGSPTVMVSYADVQNFNSGENGSRAYVENPSFVADPYNGYDLLVSVGTWDDSGSGYSTVEVPCLATNGSCVPSKGGRILSTNTGQGIYGPGGASLLTDSSPTGNWMVFAAYQLPGAEANGVRETFGGPTSSVNLNGGATALPAGVTPLPITAPAAIPSTTPIIHLSPRTPYDRT